MTYNIVVTVCIDENEQDANVRYDQLLNTSSSGRRDLYWKLAFTFCSVSCRVNPDKKHIVFTNDQKGITIKNENINQRLADMGVEVRYMPFKNFNPSVHSKIFKNAFYKVEAIAALGAEEVGSILLDTDCLWVQPCPELDEFINKDELLVSDIYERSDTPDLKGPHGQSMRDMGDLYKKIDPNYPCTTPIWYGGEVVGGSSKTMHSVAEKAKKVFDQVMKKAGEGVFYNFENGKNFLDGNEQITSFVYNSGIVKVRHINDFIRRIWTYPDINNVREGDMSLAIWHLIGEKKTGLSLLFNEALNQNSKFWNIGLLDFKYYLGEYCGIPTRKRGRYHPFLLERKLKGKVRHLLRL